MHSLNTVYHIKKSFHFFVFHFLIDNALALVITASMQKVKMDFTVNKDGVPVYSVSHD